jgi:hypothetical protein
MATEEEIRRQVEADVAKFVAERDAAKFVAARDAGQPTAGIGRPLDLSQIAAGFTAPTPEIAADLIGRSQTVGVPTSEFDRYGGYQAVKDVYNASVYTPPSGPATVNLPTTSSSPPPPKPVYERPYTPASTTPTTERGIVGYDETGPIYGDVPVKESGKRFDDAIKDLYWEVLGREPDAAGLAAYKQAFGAQISPQEEQEFYRTAKEELRNRGEGAGDPLYNLYAQNLGRAPTLEEYRKSREQFGGDVSGQEEQQFFEQEVVPDLRRRQDPIFQLYQEELGRTPDAAGYRYYQEEFGQPAYITDRMRQDFLGGGGYGGSREIPDQMGSAFRELMGRDPTDREKQELSARVGTLNRDQLGNYLATQNLAGRDRYGASPTAGYVAKNLPSNITPFTRTQGYVPLTTPNVSASVNQAGKQYYQTPTSLGANYMGAPTNIRPITQGFQPVGQPSVPSYYPQLFQPMGGKGGFQFQPQSRSQQMPSQQAPTQQFQPMGGKGVPRAITGKGG